MKIVCKHCNRKFGSIQGIVTHVRKAHGVKPAVEGTDYVVGKSKSDKPKRHYKQRKGKSRSNLQIFRVPCLAEFAYIAGEVRLIRIDERHA